MSKPKIYVASLADYTNGSLVGKWLYLSDYIDSTELLAYIENWIGELNRKFPLGYQREDWALHDYENVPNFGEYPDMGILGTYIEMINVNHCDIDCINAYFEHRSNTNCSQDDFEECYIGQYDSEFEYVEEFIESTGLFHNIPEIIQTHFDYDSYGEEIMQEISNVNGYFFEDR